MADNIVFDTIPSDTPLGGIFLEIDPSRALEGPVAVERKVLLMGQKLDSGTTPLLTPRRITSAQDAVQCCTAWRWVCRLCLMKLAF